MSKYKNHVKRDELKTIEDCHLRNLGVSSTAEINNWFIKSKNGGYWMNNIDNVTTTLVKFKNKVIFIFGDFDADGITGTSIYVLSLKWAGFSDIKYDIPLRSEGFGVNRRMVDDALFYLESIGLSASDGVILTVDNGTAAVDALNYAKECGLTVLVTDHHDPYVDSKTKEVVLPNADYLINANAVPNSADFNGCCGAGVAYKVASALLDNPKQSALLRPLAMVGTFCDVMDLVEENYVIAYYGLKTLNEHLSYNLPAFQAMAQTMSIAHWDATAVGFKFGPCINALERLEDGAAKIGVEFLTCTDYDYCLQLANTLVQYNEQRKIETEEGLILLNQEIEKMSDGPGYPIVMYVPNIKVGIVGILAGKLQEKYKAPAGVFTDGPNGVLKGSFRSPNDFNIKEHLDMVQEYFEHVGGHAGAAGASIKRDNFKNMVSALQDTAPHIENVEEDDTYYYDIELPVEYLEKAIETNEKFQPIGKGNEDLKFKITGFEVIPKYGKYWSAMRKEGARIESFTAKAISFGIQDVVSKINSPCTVTLYGTIGYNYWVRNDGTASITPQVKFDDLVIEPNTVVKSAMANKLEAMAMKRN